MGPQRSRGGQGPLLRTLLAPLPDHMEAEPAPVEDQAPASDDDKLLFADDDDVNIENDTGLYDEEQLASMVDDGQSEVPQPRFLPRPHCLQRVWPLLHQPVQPDAMAEESALPAGSGLADEAREGALQRKFPGKGCNPAR